MNNFNIVDTCKQKAVTRLHFLVFVCAGIWLLSVMHFVILKTQNTETHNIYSVSK